MIQSGKGSGAWIQVSLAAMLGTVVSTANGAESAQAVPIHERVKSIAIVPSETDPAIKSFNSPHYLYVNRDIIVTHDRSLPADRHELLLWIPGTKPPEADSATEGKGGADAFCKIAANLGYHVIILKYPNDVSASICRNENDPRAFEDFRMALIAGGASRHLTITRTDSIENRQIKLLIHLRTIRPREEWGQFLDANGSIRWEAIAVSGQSQGGGHAALIAIKHRVSRVICTGAPKDYSLALDKSAAWYNEESATPKARFFAFNHLQDYQACTPRQQLENLHALQLDAFGAPADVDRESFPYHHSHILVTDYPGKKLESGPAHTSVMNPRNAAVFAQVWSYMLTESTP